MKKLRRYAKKGMIGVHKIAHHSHDYHDPLHFVYYGMSALGALEHLHQVLCGAIAGLLLIGLIDRIVSAMLDEA
jgi:hypothetical protein